MRPWSAYFALITVIIVTTMALPDPFGFERIAQWGGMYTDGWCQGTLRVVSGNDPLKTEDIGITVGNDPPVRMVWYAPQFTEKTCAEWLMHRCHTLWQDKEVTEVFAMWRHLWIREGANLCDSEEPLSGWFAS